LFEDVYKAFCNSFILFFVTFYFLLLEGILMGFISLLFLLRPLEWSKSFGNMLFGYLLALFLANGFVSVANFDFFLFLFAFIAVGPLLWGGLYALNDVTDTKSDKKHSLKKSRPIPSGKISEKTALIFSLLLIFLSLLIGFYFFVFFGNFLFLFCLIAMLLNQVLYCVNPFRFKSRPIVDLVSGSIINPFFRFYSGWVLVFNDFNAPLLILIFVCGIQFAGFSLYRMNSKELEKKLNYRSSIVVFGERKLLFFSYLVGLIAVFSFVLMTLTERFFPELLFLGFLPLKFLWLVVLSVFLLPLYLRALLEPKKMNLKKMYALMYLHNILFIAGFVFLFFVN
jgi:4-hydroxybenzoate polyprenyltransferase